MREFSIGFVPFGEVNTPPEAIRGRSEAALTALRNLGYPVHATTPVVDDPGYREARRAVAELSAQRFDLLVICMAGWVPTHAVIKVIDRFRHLPMLLWSLCGWTEGERLISTADQAGATALSGAMRGMRYRYHYVYSVAGQPLPMAEIGRYAAACRAAACLRDARLGTVGYRDMLLYGTMFDGLSLRRQIGVEVEPAELLEVWQKAGAADPAEVARVMDYVRGAFEFTAPCDDAPIEAAARHALAIGAIARARDWDAVTVVDVDGYKKLLGLPPAMVLMLLDRLWDLGTMPENDIPGSVTQLMIRYATGQAGAYLEFYEFFEDTLLCGVPDYIPAEITKGPARIQPAAFGLLSTSLLNVSDCREGEVTLARLQYQDGEYGMHLLRGEARAPRRWEECGWAPPAPRLPSLEIVPEGGVRAFADKVGAQHITVAYGDHTETLRHLCRLLDIRVL